MRCKDRSWKRYRHARNDYAQLHCFSRRHLILPFVVSSMRDAVMMARAWEAQKYADGSAVAIPKFPLILIRQIAIPAQKR
jgi:hypothetical protein